MSPSEQDANDPKLQLEYRLNKALQRIQEVKTYYATLKFTTDRKLNEDKETIDNLTKSLNLTSDALADMKDQKDCYQACTIEQGGINKELRAIIEHLNECNDTLDEENSAQNLALKLATQEIDTQRLALEKLAEMYNAEVKAKQTLQLRVNDVQALMESNKQLAYKVAKLTDALARAEHLGFPMRLA